MKIDCECRKPKPGLLLKAANDFNIDLSKSFMVGDGENDIKAGIAAGCISILIGQNVGYGESDNVNGIFQFVEKYIDSKVKNSWGKKR